MRGRYVYLVKWHIKMDDKIERREKSFDIFQFLMRCVLATVEIEPMIFKKTGFSFRH
jgi:hypothetical protein